MFSDPTLTVGGTGNRSAVARESPTYSEESGLDGNRLVKGPAISPLAVRQVSENQTGAPPGPSLPTSAAPTSDWGVLQFRRLINRTDFCIRGVGILHPFAWGEGSFVMESYLESWVAS
jgi:hypothetical protein